MNTSVPTPSVDAPSVSWPYSADAEHIRQRCEALIPRMREHAVENEANRRIDAETVEALREAGAFTISYPRRWGGYALMPSEQARIIQTVARGDSGIAWNVSLGSVHAQAVTRTSEEFQEEVFRAGRGPAFAGAGPMPGSSARKVEGGWMVKGRWDYASTSEHADWLMGGAIVDGPDGSKMPLGFFLPKNEEWLLDNWDVMGLSSSNSQSFELTEEVFVPDHRTGLAPLILAGPPPEYADEEPLYGVHIPVFAQMAGLANALGTFEGVLDQWEEAAQTRRVAHPDFQTQAENPITHLKAGSYRAFLAAGQAVLDKLAAFADELAISRRMPSDVEMAENSAMSNYVLYQVAERALDVLRDSTTAAIRRTHPIQRALRDIIVMNTHAASDRDRSFEGLGRQVLGFGPMGFIVPGVNKAPGAPGAPGGAPSAPESPTTPPAHAAQPVPVAG